jgi:hypothetical protein
VFREGAAKRWQGCVQAGLLSREINEIGVPTLSKRRKATPQTALCASRRRALRGQRTRACTSIFMRENREVPRSPVHLISGWAVQGTLRR